MDLITHISVGACLGEAFAGKKLGRKAMIWGALANSFPDIDVATVLWMDTVDGLLAHRGITHSLVFVGLVSPLFAILADKWHKSKEIGYKRWTIFFLTTISLHLFLDLFNNYGIALLEPFSHQRFSLNAVYVADPFLSIAPFVALMVLLVKSEVKNRALLWKFGLIWVGAYLCYGLFNKFQVERAVSQSLERQKIPCLRYFTTPAPLQNWLWFVVAETNTGFEVAYRSVFDRSDSLDYTHFSKNDELHEMLTDQNSLNKLKQFSQGYYTLENWSDTLVFNDLRFGQTIGWYNPTERFAFHYYLNYPDANKTVVQRGRFAKWDKESVNAFWNRIKGN
jgi:inner membrane protein